MVAPGAVALPPAPALRDGTDLLLRRHRADDGDGVYQQCQDPEIVRFTTVPAPYRRSDADGFLDHVATGWADGTLAALAIEVDGGFAGSVDLRFQDGAWAEVGFGLAPGYRGRGVTTRSLRLLLGRGFGELGLAGVQWPAVVGNDASRQVAQACGVAVEGTVRGLLVHRGRRLDGWIGTLLATDTRPRANRPDRRWTAPRASRRRNRHGRGGFLDSLSAYAEHGLAHTPGTRKGGRSVENAAGTGTGTLQAPVTAGVSGESSELLRRLVVRGMLRGVDAADTDPLVDAGLALAKGPLVMPSTTGTEAVARELRLLPGGEQEQAVWPLFRTFLPVNRQLRDLCTAWQRRPDGSGNDHSDAAYDAAVRDDLDDVHRKVVRVVRKLDAVVPGLGRYSELLGSALERLDAGETNMLTSPLTESYHTVWMWLHQELLLMLGVSRAEDERLEEELVSGQPGS